MASPRAPEKKPGASVQSETDGDGLLDQSGRLLGPRARDTRRRLLRATLELMAEKSLRELRVIDIARKIDTSPATFYQYFRDVKEIVLCLARAATDEMPAMLELIEAPWEGEVGIERAQEIVEAFIRHWDEHLLVLRARNQASDEGDRDFARVRSEAMSPVLAAFASKIRANQSKGDVRSDVSPEAAAAAMAAILERLAAYHNELERVGVSRDDLVVTSARILLATVTGRS